mmetsp:Transcript_173127/g.555117  ORF Transcript_173127/g.555117 Transcript_173127/m.555117 type:complete len:986 (+) Transcript_173127:38-2995(+)
MFDVQGSDAAQLSTLWSQLAATSGERDSAKKALEGLRAAVNRHRPGLRSLAAVCEVATGGVGLGEVQRARELVKTLESDVRQAVGDSGSISGTSRASGSTIRGNYVALRRSLEEAEQRCDGLNRDMAKQAETNDRLLETMGALKDANRRLLEQIRCQTDEISRLTRQRLGEEEEKEVLSRKQEREREAFRRDVRERCVAIKDEARRRQDAEERWVTDRLGMLRGRARALGEDASVLRQEQPRLRADVALMADGMRKWLGMVTSKVLARCAAVSEVEAQQQEVAVAQVKKLEEELQTEESLRRKEALSWGCALSDLSVTVEGAQARSARDVSQMTMQLQALENVLAEERSEQAAARQRLERRLGELARRHTEQQAELEEAQTGARLLEADVDNVRSAIRAQEQEVAELRRKARMCDDSRSCAESGNTHLVKQLYEQRSIFTERSGTELRDTEMAASQRIENTRRMHQACCGFSSRAVRSLEDDAAGADRELTALLEEVDGITTECEDLQREVGDWRAQHDSTRAARLELEKDLAEHRKRGAVEKVGLQSAIERATSEIRHLEASVQTVDGELEGFRRSSAARELEHGLRYRAAEASLKELQDELLGLRRRQAEVVAAKLEADTEVAESQRKAKEVELALGNGIETRRVAMHDELGRLEAELSQELEVCGKLEQALEQERRNGPEMVRQAQGDSLSKLGVLESSRNRVQQVCRAEEEEADQALAFHRQRRTDLERELSSLKRTITEKEAGLARLESEAEREERDAATMLKRLTEEGQSLRRAVEKASEEQIDLQQRLDDVAKASAEEKLNLSEELDELRRAADMEASELEGSFRQGQAERERELERAFDLSGLLGRRDADEETEDEQALRKENEQLRSLLTQQGRSSTGLSKLHNRLEGHIQRLQQHTDDLRHSIHSSPSILASPAAALLPHTGAPVAPLLFSSPPLPLMGGAPLGTAPLGGVPTMPGVGAASESVARRSVGRVRPQ